MQQPITASSPCTRSAAGSDMVKKGASCRAVTIMYRHPTAKISSVRRPCRAAPLPRGAAILDATHFYVEPQ
jgi:hypothetical protein